MSAEAIVFFDPELAQVARYRRKRAGHLQSKGRFLAAQLLGSAIAIVLTAVLFPRAGSLSRGEAAR